MDYRGIHVDNRLASEIERCPDCDLRRDPERPWLFLNETAPICTRHSEMCEKGYQEYMASKEGQELKSAFGGYSWDFATFNEASELLEGEKSCQLPE